MRTRHLISWFKRRIGIVVAVAILGIGVIPIWSINTNSSQATIITVKIAAISALFAAISSFATLIQAVEAQKQRESLERPYIILFFDITSSGEINFFIQNIGNSPAMNIIIKFTEPIPTDFTNRPLGDFERPIGFLPPGKSVRQLMGYGHSLLDEKKPTKFCATIHYSSVYNGMFKDEIEQDLAYLRQITFPQKSIEESLETISRNLNALSGQLSTSRSMWGPPTVEDSLNTIAREIKLLVEHTSKPPKWKSLLNLIFRSRESPPEDEL